MEVLETSNVSKFYGETRAVDDISIQVKKGEIYGFLGLNGAGKTTLIRMLLGMIKPASGSVHLFGKGLKREFAGTAALGYLCTIMYWALADHTK